jgi:hypothetical protein
MPSLSEITHIISPFLFIIIRAAILGLFAAPLVVIATRVVAGYEPSYRQTYTPTFLAFFTGNILATAILVVMIQIQGSTRLTYGLFIKLLLLNVFYLSNIPGNSLWLVLLVMAAVLLSIGFLFGRIIKYPTGTGVGFTKGSLIVCISSLLFALLVAILGIALFLALFIINCLKLRNLYLSSI